MDCSTSGFPVLHYLSEFAQIHVHWVGDAIQTSNPLSLPSPPALDLSQHQFFFFFSPVSQLFTSGRQSIGTSASVLEINIQGWFSLGLIGLISLQPRRLSKVFSSTTIQNHHFFSTQLSLIYFQLSHPYMTNGKTITLTMPTFSAKWCFCFLICCLSLS